MSALNTGRRMRFSPDMIEALTLDGERAAGFAPRAHGALRTDQAHRGVPRRNEGGDEAWGVLEMVPAPRPDVVFERPRAIITRNESPDIFFERAINPYRAHDPGCAYDLAPQLRAMAETAPGSGDRLFAKAGAAELLEKELAAPRYQVKAVALGTDTDPYHPVERTERVTRSILEVLARTNHPVGIITKSALVLRDLDLLAPMARRGLVKVAIPLTTLDPELARRLEPGASAPERRLHAIEALSDAGVPVTAMVAPIIPAINDAEIETILTRAHARGAREAGYVTLRLPPESQALFGAWLLAHYPDKHRHVMTLVKSMSQGSGQGSTGKALVGKGRATDPVLSRRSDATGPFAWMIGRRFETAVAKNGYAPQRMKVRTDLFTRPAAKGEQLSLML